MTLNQFLAILRARWVIAMIVLSIVLATTALVSFTMQKSYTAEASVVIDYRMPDPISGLAAPVNVSPTLVGTQVDIIRSERVTNKVIRDLRLSQDEQIRAQWIQQTQGKGSFQSWLAELLQRSLVVKPSRDSNVVSIGFGSVNPEFAAAMANAFTRAYIETTLDLRIEPAKQFSALFDEQAKVRRETLERAQAKLSEYQRANGLIATDERLDIESSRLSELSSQLVIIQSLAADSSSRTAAAVRNGDRMIEVLSNPVISALASDLARAEASAKELASRNGDAHPSVIQLKANITELKARIDAETRKVSGSVSITNSVNQARESQIRQELERQRQKVLKLKEQRDGANVLLKDVEVAQRAYDGVTSRLSQTTLESQANQTNVAILKQASPPATPTSPKILVNMALSAVLGAVLAMASVLMMEMTSRRLRTEDDILVDLSVTLLGSLPRPGREQVDMNHDKGALKLSSTMLPRMLGFQSSKNQ
jgi:polysaccharide biosynthesis transport protein